MTDENNTVVENNTEVKENTELENNAKVEKNTVVENETPNYDISKFKLTKILRNDASRKLIIVLGSFPDLSEDEKAIILLEKNAFKEDHVSTTDSENTYFNEKLETKIDFINSIYGSYQCYPPAILNGIKATVIFPATDKHVEKYSIREKYIITETPALYEEITKPYLKSGQFNVDWVYNILEHKQEQDRIVYEDDDKENGFILVPDLKWDGKTIETMYLLAIVHRRDLKSIRDLNGTHLQLLRNIRDAGCDAIQKKFGIEKSQLRIYFHYQPTFYHLHVHFNSLRYDAPGIHCETGHLLDTVINNVELLSDYYQKATIPFAAFEGNKLLEKFQEQNIAIKKM